MGPLTSFLPGLLKGAAGGVGNYLTGSAQTAANNNQTRQQNIQGQTNAYGNMSQFNANQDMTRQQMGVGLTDPSQIQAWRQRQAVLGALMPQMRNVSVSAAPGLEGYKPQISGGMRLPEGGFDAATLAFFSPEARLSAENTYWENAAPFLQSTPDLSSAGYGAGSAGASGNAANTTSHLRDVQQMFARNNQMGNQQRLTDIMGLAQQNPIQEEGSWLGALLSAILGGLGGIGANMTPTTATKPPAAPPIFAPDQGGWTPPRF